MAQAAVESCPKPLPKPKDFINSILIVVGSATGFVPGQSMLFKDAVPAILEDAGFDESQVPPEWMFLNEVERVPHLHARVRWAIKGLQDRNLMPRIRGSLGLTPEGVEIAQKLHDAKVSVLDSQEDSKLSTALLKALGRQSGYSTDPVAESTALHSALVEFGADLRKPNLELKQQVRLSYQNLLEQHRSKVRQAGEGEWALSKIGVRRSLWLADHTPNATSQWVNRNWDEIYKNASRLLTFCLPKTAVLGEIDDLIYDKVAVLIKRNSLLSHLEMAEGRKLPTVKNILWMIRSSAYTRIRGYGVDAHMRTISGARTERGLDEKREWQKKVHGYVDNKGHAVPPEPIHYPNKALAEKEGAYFVPEFEDREFIDPMAWPDKAAEGMDLIEKSEAVVHKTFGEREGFDKYLSVWRRHFLEGWNFAEIASEWGVSSPCVAKYAHEVKEVLRRAVERGQLELVAA